MCSKFHLEDLKTVGVLDTTFLTILLLLWTTTQFQIKTIYSFYIFKDKLIFSFTSSCLTFACRKLLDANECV